MAVRGEIDVAPMVSAPVGQGRVKWLAVDLDDQAPLAAGEPGDWGIEDTENTTFGAGAATTVLFAPHTDADPTTAQGAPAVVAIS